jgi:Domain of unknown function (DUF5916)/Carbohydrate family 9 binding domain-like
MTRATMRTSMFLLILLFCFATLAVARNSQAPPPKICQTLRVEGAAPITDGLIDDEAWNLVEWSGDFVQRSPDEGQPPLAQTEFKMLYDDEAIYFAFRMHDNPEEVRSILARRDWFPGDWVEVNIDSYHDFRTAFSFTLSLSGTRGDEFVSNDGSNWSGSWDPIWEGATHIDSQGWTAEMRIPLSQLRFGNAENQVWGLQVQRRIFREEQRSTWQSIPRDITGWVSNFGEIHGIQGINPGRRIEIMPYVVAKAERFEKIEGDPFHDGDSSSLGLGVDGKIGLSSDFTVDFTVNPDFGQVEADPSQVNLTAFETYFQEKRPFFIEGADIFNLPVAPAITGGHFTRDRLFYSRRLGKRPSFSPDLADDEYADVPTNTSILGALKLSGKTADGLSVGILESVTARERADIKGSAGSRDESVEPATNYFVGRVMQDFREGNTVVGAMMTAVNRDIQDEHLEFLRRSAYAGGFDVQHYFADRNYKVEGRIFGSHLRGDAEAIDDVQTSSARYFQRPDNDHTDYDPTLTAISGTAGSLLARRTNNAGNLQFQTGAAWRSPGFEINDIGYMRRADEINQSTWVGYNKRHPFSIFNDWQMNGNQWLDWDWGGHFLGAAANVNSNWTFKNRWGGRWELTRDSENTSNTELRGGPSSKWPGAVSGGFSLWSDHSKDIRGNAGYWFRQGDEDYINDWNTYASVSIRPSDALQISVNPSYSHNRHEMQYIDTNAFDGDDRYLFGSLDQKTFSLTFRVDYCLTPNLTVQYYGSPFISAGSFGDFKRTTDPRADSYRDRFHSFGSDEIAYDDGDGVYEVDENADGAVDYEIDNPDFNFLDFNSNLVVRWEYDPGSTIYLVWSQARSDFLSTGEMDLGNDVDTLFDKHPHNVFLLKFNKWFSL